MASSWRLYTVEARVTEARDIDSFTLVPSDGAPPPPHLPGQHLPLRLPGSPAVHRRVYTISSAPNGRSLRISVKRIGVVSSALHDALVVGATLECSTPGGEFFLQSPLSKPVVLLSGGIGVTPLLAMLEGLAQRELASVTTPSFLWLYGARNGDEHPFRSRIEDLSRTHPKALRVHVAYSAPSPSDLSALGTSYHSAGRIDAQLLERVIPTALACAAVADAMYFVCGPSAFMRDVLAALRAAGVHADAIATESFGPSAGAATVDASPLAGVVSTATAPPAAPAATLVRFSRSNKTAAWRPKQRGAAAAQAGGDGEGVVTGVAGCTLLELAEQCGIDAPFGCRGGMCGSCAARVTSGGVGSAPGTSASTSADAGEALLCCSVPDGTGEVSIEL